MFLKKWTIVAVCMFGGSSLIAQDEVASIDPVAPHESGPVKAGSFSHTSKISVLRIYPSGDMALSFRLTHPECTSPTTPPRYLVKDSESFTRDAVDAVRDAAISAAESGRLVTVYFDASSSECRITELFVKY